MSADDPNDLAEVILHFLGHLPATDGKSLPVMVLAYAGLAVPENLDTIPEALRGYLTSGNAFTRTGRVIAAAAHIDHVLFEWVESAPRNRAVLDKLAADEPDNPTWQKLRLGIPLREKHTEQTEKRWQELRRTVLTSEGINAYYERLFRLSSQ